MKRSALKSRAPMKRVSDRRKEESKEYLRKRLDFLLVHERCQIENCTNPSTQIHHARGRYRFYLDESTWFACCAKCHSYIEVNREWAREKGYLVYGKDGK